MNRAAKRDASPQLSLVTKSRWRAKAFSNGWNTFVVANNIVEVKPVIVGERGRDYTRIIAGLVEGERVILYPSDLVTESISVTY